MVNDKMVVSAGNAGELLVRVDADHHDALLSEPGAARAEMGAGRSMGPGWIIINPEALTEDEHLNFWVNAAMSYNQAITQPKPQ